MGGTRDDLKADRDAGARQRRLECLRLLQRHVIIGIPVQEQDL